MTEKQIDRAKSKIEKYKKALAADKKFWRGYYHDGRGIRYIIPALFIKIKDYKGCLRYFNWFDKNFPGDAGYPVLLFEWTFILFKRGKLIEAEQKAHSTFFANIYLFNYFLGKEPLQLHKNETLTWEYQSLVENFIYISKDTEFIEFGAWIEKVLTGRLFLDKANEFIEIEQKLKSEPVGKKRTQLVNRLSEITHPKKK